MTVSEEDNYENDTTNKQMKLIVHKKKKAMWYQEKSANLKSMTFQQSRGQAPTYL